MLVIKYVLTIFTKIFLCILGGCLGIFVLIDFTGNINKFAGASAADTVLYYWYHIPYICSIIVPVALLLSSMFAMGLLSKNSELTALRASGFSLLKVCVPLLAFGLAGFAGMFAMSEIYLPIANEKKKTVEDVNIRKKRTRTGSYRSNLYFQGD